MLRKTEYLLVFFLLFLVKSNITFAQNPKFEALFNEVDRISYIKRVSSLAMIDTLYQMANHDKDSALLIAQTLYVEAAMNGRQGIVDTFLSHRIEKRLARQNIPLQEQAILECALGSNLHATGAFSEAFSLQYKAIEKFKQLPNNIFTARALHSLGAICLSIGLYSLSEYYLLEALTYADPQWFGYIFMKNNIFISKWLQDRTYSIIDSLTALLEFAEKENREEAIPILCLNLGSRFLKSDPQKALSYFTTMQAMEFDNPKTRANLFGNMSSYYMDINNNNQAYKCLIEAKNIMETNHDYNSLPKLYHNFSFFYESQQQYDSALYYAQKELELTQKIFSNTIAIETHQKYVTTFLEAAQKDLTIAEQKVKIKNNQFIIITVVSGALIILILLFLLLVNQQKRRKASENRELTVKLEHEKAKSEHEKKVQQYEKRTQKLEREKQKEVLDAKTREITSYSLLVSNKNQLLQQIMELTAQIFNNKENATKTAAKIEEVIQNNLTIDKEWANFKMHFDNVHPHFFEKLKQCCHDLTEENIKMCAYIKMGMTPKQIAQLQHVAPRSVIINRYRLKKKLQIPEEEDLEHFIGIL